MSTALQKKAKLVSLEDIRQVLVDECNVDIYKKIMDEK